MAYVKIFKAADDSQVSEAPAITNAVEAVLRADEDEVGEWERLYALGGEL